MVDNTGKIIVDIPGHLPVGIVEVSRLAQSTVPGDVSMGVVPVFNSIACLVLVLAICFASC